jgi:hypothetical protein
MPLFQVQGSAFNGSKVKRSTLKFAKAKNDGMLCGSSRNNPEP